ncbi:MAG: phospholipase, partial [Candidatus Diapherotrites archaeon]|nr:phospholipase [Candidatus Diapherotrites archaeon]
MSSVQVYKVEDYCRDVGNLIDSAKDEIDVAVYLIRYRDTNCPEILLEKLVEARERGVDVRVFTEEDDYNERAVEFLREHNVPVFIVEPFLHAKALKVDDCVVVGSHNWTWNAMHRNVEVSLIVCNTSVLD